MLPDSEKPKGDRSSKIIQRGGDLPLYRQVAETLRLRIEQRVFKPGDRIPTEYELCDEFGVSRISIRHALAELVHMGLLYRRQGSGTYVRHESGTATGVLRAIVTESEWMPPLQAAVDAYNQDHRASELRLDIQVVGRPQLRSKILGAVGCGNAPDLGLLDWPWVAEFADLHFLQALEDLDAEWVREFRADAFSAFVSEGEPALYAVRPEANVSVIWYRRDWLEAAGIEPPRTWNALVEAAKRFAINGRYSIAFTGGTVAGETTTYQLLPFLWAAGDDLLVGNRVGLGERAIQAVAFLADLVHKHKVAPPEVAFYTWDQPARLFARGEVAFAVGGSYEKVRIQELAGWTDEDLAETVGCIPIPPPLGGEPATVAGGMAYVVFRQSRLADVAFEIVRRVASPDIMRAFCSRTGRCPTRMSVVRSLDREQDAFTREIAELLHNARPRLGIPEYFKVSEQFQIMTENAITQRLTAEEAVGRAREIIRILVASRS